LIELSDFICEWKRNSAPRKPRKNVLLLSPTQPTPDTNREVHPVNSSVASNEQTPSNTGMQDLLNALSHSGTKRKLFFGSPEQCSAGDIPSTATLNTATSEAKDGVEVEVEHEEEEEDSDDCNVADYDEEMRDDFGDDDDANVFLDDEAVEDDIADNADIGFQSRRRAPHCPFADAKAASSSGDPNSAQLPVPMSFLLIVPASLIDTWVAELNRWGHFRVSIYYRVSANDPVDLIRSYASSGHSHRIPEVVIVTYKMFPRLVSRLSTVWFEAVFLDEAHVLKNSATLAYKAAKKLSAASSFGAIFGLTGTPIQNSLMDMFNILDLFVPRCLGIRKHFVEHYKRPIEVGQSSKATKEAISKQKIRRRELHELQSKYMLRRDKSVIEQDLQGKTKQTITVMCAMSPSQELIYRAILESSDVRLVMEHVNRPAQKSSKDKKDVNSIVNDQISDPRRNSKGSRNPLLFECISSHQSGNPCEQCPLCLVLPVLRKLGQVGCAFTI
jgi:hypothetical protein